MSLRKAISEEAGGSLLSIHYVIVINLDIWHHVFILGQKMAMNVLEKTLLFGVGLAGFLAVIERDRVKQYFTAMKMHAGKNPVPWVFCGPVIAILVLFVLFITVSSLSGVEVGKRGVYGDSFGVITSLFTGLGFAGLTITLVIQQMQIGKQEHESQAAKNELATERYEATLHQLLTLYKNSVESVVIKNDGVKVEGLDAIGLANNKILKTLRKNKVTVIPSDVARRFGEDGATEQDQRILDHLFQRNGELIQAAFSHQGRLIKSFTLLMHHLEDRKPTCFHSNDMKYPRMMIHSQLTHLEVSYFFYLALGFREEENVRRLLRTSGLLEAFPTICQYEIHRYMYMHLWNYDPRTGLAPHTQTSRTRVDPGNWEFVDDEADGFTIHHRDAA